MHGAASIRANTVVMHMHLCNNDGYMHDTSSKVLYSCILHVVKAANAEAA